MKPPQSKVQAHVFVPDHSLPPDHQGRYLCEHAGCGLPEANAHHDTSQLDAAQAEQRRWIGETE